MNPIITKSVTIAILAYWWLIIIWMIIKYRKDRSWKPTFIAKTEDHFKINFKTINWIRYFIIVEIILAIAFWQFPEFL